VAEAAKSTAPRRRTEKSASAFRTISEVSTELDVPPHVLRFWESKFAQVKPLKRGGGRRYYRPEDIELLRSIRELLYTEGYTIKGVQKLLREGGAKFAAPPDVGKSEEIEPIAEISSARPVGGSPPSKDELREILDELESLRDLLRSSFD
jgi:DNA-binding transcriptional MerR regulator